MCNCEWTLGAVGEEGLSSDQSEFLAAVRRVEGVGVAFKLFIMKLTVSRNFETA